MDHEIELKDSAGRFAGFDLITFPQLSVLFGRLRDYFFNYDNDSLS